MSLNCEGREGVVPTLATVLEEMVVQVVSPMSLNLKGEGREGEVPNLATVLEEMVVQVVSPMSLNLKGEGREGEVPTLATVLEEMVVQVLSPMSLNLKGEGREGEVSTLATGLEVVVYPTTLQAAIATTRQVSSLLNLGEHTSNLCHATTMDGLDSDVAACPTTTNSLNQTNPPTNAG